MNIPRLKEESDTLEDLRIQRAELMQKQAKEIGALDNAINQQWAKVSSLISILAETKAMRP